MLFVKVVVDDAFLCIDYEEDFRDAHIAIFRILLTERLIASG